MRIATNPVIFLLILVIYFVKSVIISVLFSKPVLASYAGSTLTIIGGLLVIFQLSLEKIANQVKNTGSNLNRVNMSETVGNFLLKNHQSFLNRAQSDRIGIIVSMAILVIIGEVLSTWGVQISQFFGST